VIAASSYRLSLSFWSDYSHWKYEKVQTGSLKSQSEFIFLFWTFWSADYNRFQGGSACQCRQAQIGIRGG
jgi:hypothetical protein